jgi:hypothetical protein
VRNKEECIFSVCPPANHLVSCLTRLSADFSYSAEGAYTIRLLFVSVSVMCEFTQDSWKMYRYTLDERVFIVRGRTGKGLSKIWRAGFNPVWTQIVATSRKCYDVVTFLTQRTYRCSSLVAISLLLLELLTFWNPNFTFKF